MVECFVWCYVLNSMLFTFAFPRQSSLKEGFPDAATKVCIPSMLLERIRETGQLCSICTKALWPLVT